MKTRLFTALILLPVLAAGLVSGCGTTSVDESLPAVAVVKNITVAEAKALIDERYGDDGFIILDVRTPAEYADDHIEGALNIDVNSGSFVTDLEELDRGHTYLVYCHSGGRSAGASQTMIEQGFKDVYNMTGGFRDWTSAGYPSVP